MAVRKVVESATLFIKDRWGARRDYKSVKKITTVGFLGGLSSLILPYITPFTAGLNFSRFLDFYLEYFGNKNKKAYYEVELRPFFTERHFVQVGYEVANDELDEHKAVLRQGGKALSKKAEYILKHERYRIVGIDKDTLTRHFTILGTTGAGKTSFLMTLFEKIMSVGGGLIFVDGKADDDMFKKLYSLAKQYGREQDVYLINFLRSTGDLRGQSNTFNPLLTLPPVQIVSFLASLLGEAGGDAEYWQGRGKALLRPIVFFYDFRRRFWGELFSYENIQQGIEPKDTGILAVLTYVMALDLEMKLREDNRVKVLYEEGLRKSTPTSELEYLQVLRTLFITEPYRIEEFEQLGYDEKYLTMLYSVYATFRSFLTGISQTWWDAIVFTGKVFYEYLIKNGYNIRELNLGDLRKKFVEFLKEYKTKLNSEENEANEGEKEKIEIIENPNLIGGDAIQQHAYASQQWTEIFSQFEVFSDIIGSTNPDIDFVDILKNNKILYVLLPALEQDKKTVNLLGKMIVVALRQAFATALGGRVKLTNEEKDIYKSRLKPKPIGLAVLDEYGAFPVSGIDTILAQVRSLNISFMLSVQDYQSLRAEDKEGEARRAWANTSKIIFQIKDSETMQKLREYMKKKFTAVYQSFATTTTDLKETIDMQIQQMEDFDPTDLISAEKGFGVCFVDRPVFFQSFWADAPFPDRLELLQFESVE